MPQGLSDSSCLCKSATLVLGNATMESGLRAGPLLAEQLS
jgi:hypothetical protein